MTGYQDIAYRLRWLILIAGLLCLTAGLWWVVLAPPLEHGAGMIGTLAHAALQSLTSLVGIDDVEEPWIGVPYLGVFLVPQWFFLQPRQGLVGLELMIGLLSAANIGRGLVGLSAFHYRPPAGGRYPQKKDPALRQGLVLRPKTTITFPTALAAG